jgi:hypothetical protein
MDSDSDSGEIRPDPKRHRARRRRWYLFVLVPAILLALTMILSGTRRCTALGASSGVSFRLNPILAGASSPVHVRACVARLGGGSVPGRGFAISREQVVGTIGHLSIGRSCAVFTMERWGSKSFALCDGPTCPQLPAPNGAIAMEIFNTERNWELQDSWAVQVIDPALTSTPITVSLSMKDQAGNSIFDSSAVVQPHKFQPNGPFCDPTVYTGRVIATGTGRLIPQP